MSWRVALVLDEKYSVHDLGRLIHQMPIWAVTTPERRLAAASIRNGAGEIWAPESALTLFFPSSLTDKEETCRSVLGTVQEHHPQLAWLDLIGIPPSETLVDVLQAAGFELIEAPSEEGLAFRKPVDALQDVQELILDAGQWQTVDDLYDSFFEAVGAPPWHGRNFDALHDGIVTGDINRVEVPYRIRIQNFAQTGTEARQVTDRFVALIQRFEREGCPVSVRIEE